jgi:hypothetical protein
MGGQGSIDEKLAPRDFVSDFVWAVRAVFDQPIVALVSIAVWVLSMILQNYSWNHSIAAGGLSLLFLLFMPGWFGAERLFFLRRREGKKVTLRELLAAVPVFMGRFIRLGLLVLIPLMLLVGVVFFYVGRHDPAAPHGSRNLAVTLTSVMIMVPLDVALTFVTSALVYRTRSVWQALGIGLSMIRKTWPRSGLYVLCPPLALNLLNTIYPTHIPLVSFVTTAGLTLLALLAKGATAAFYLREGGPVSADALPR